MACTGDAKEICGGANANLVATVPDQYLIGCYVDNVNNTRDLPVQIEPSSLPVNSIEICAAKCAQKDYLFAGLQFGYGIRKYDK